MFKPISTNYKCMQYDLTFLIQIAAGEKDSFLASIPDDLKEKGSTLYASLIDGKVYKGSIIE